MSNWQESLRSAASFLAGQQNADGGWAYVPGKQSFPEPTCYALLALAGAPDQRPREERALAWLTRHHSPAGTLALEGDEQQVDNWGTILALFTLHSLKIGEELSQRFLRHLLRTRGNRLDRATSAELKLDGDLQAWPWALGTASWVEPTAYALITLKSQGLGQHERVKEGEAYLLDRACYGGGWNYGNKEVLSVRLEAMPTITAYALLALQDFPRRHEVIQKSVAYLETELGARQSTLTLALGALCLDLYGRPTEALVQGLLARQEGDGSWRGNTHLTSLAALALKAVGEKQNIFRV